MNSLKKPLPWLASAIALSVSVAAALPAFAQSTHPTAPAPSGQAQHSNPLNLTAEQQNQIRQIRQSEQSQIAAILTPQQLQQLQQNYQSQQTHPTAAANPGARRSPLDALNLSSDQRSRIEQVVRTSHDQMNNVLTAEQRQLIQQRINAQVQHGQGQSSSQTQTTH